MILTDVPAEFIRNASDRQAIEDGCRWSPEHAERIIAFANSLFRPQYVAGTFRLLDWQVQFLMALYGWRRPGGTRRFRTAVLHVAKKNGKTLLVAIIAAYELFCSEHPSPFVASGSVTRDNASQVFNELRNTLRKSPLGPYASVTGSSKRITVPGTNGEYRALSSDGDSAQGFNLSCAIVDEYHAHKNNSLYDSLRYSTIARQGLLIVISTAGDSPTHAYYSLYSRSKRIISGEDIDTTHLPVVYESDPDADPLDPAQWAAANPSLGVSFKAEDFKRELLAAKQSVPEWLMFSRYRLNRWIRPDELAFCDVQQLDRNKLTVSEDELILCPCWFGLDLSSSIDPSSVSICWLLPDGRFHIKSWAWVCRKGIELREKSNLKRYQEFIAEKSMVMTDGDMIEHRLILAWVRNAAKKYRPKMMRFDGNNALIISETLMSEGWKVEITAQYPKFYDGPMREWERATADGRLTHDGSGWFRYCCGNVRSRLNDQGFVCPDKKRSPDKIDGFVSGCLSFGPAVVASVKPKPAKIEWW